MYYKYTIFWMEQTQLKWKKIKIEKDGKVYYVTKSDLIISKQYYNLFKYSTKGGDFIRRHTSLTTFVTFDFSKINVAQIFIHANFYFFTTCFQIINLEFFVFKTMVSNPQYQCERLRSCFAFLQLGWFINHIQNI